MDERVESIFGGTSSGEYNRATIEKIKKNFQNLQENQNVSNWQIQDEFALINFTRAELGD